jgi:hypothetical protein
VVLEASFDGGGVKVVVTVALVAWTRAPGCLRPVHQSLSTTVTIATSSSSSLATPSPSPHPVMRTSVAFVQPGMGMGPYHGWRKAVPGDTTESQPDLRVPSASRPVARVREMAELE